MASWLQAADAIRSTLLSAFQGLQLPQTKIYVGFPEPNLVQKDLRDRSTPYAHISIWHTGMVVPTSRYALEEKIVKFDATEVVQVANSNVTISGTPTQGDNIFIHINGAHTFAAPVDLDDDLAAIASKLAAAVNASSIGVTASPTGNVISLSANPTLVASVVGAAFGRGSSTTEVTREQVRFSATIWAPDEIVRDQISTATKEKLSAKQFLDFADLSSGRILYAGELPNDAPMSAGYVTGRVLYWVEFATYNTEYFARVGTIVGTVGRCVPDNSISTIQTFEVY